MKRKIVIIAVVVCLDLAFIVLLRVGFRSADLSQSIDAPANNPILVARKPAVSPLSEAGTAEVEQVPDLEHARTDQVAAVKRPPFRRTKTARPLELARVFPRRRRTTVPDQQTPQFTDTVIWIQRASYVKDQGEGVAITGIKATENLPAKQKKKSFFSRAIPVIKKPYDWLKSLGSIL